jgi:ubiquinone/menaquinone biosynthesis C-methylase UbiE
VCGGSGMDAEYLARCGARVVSADISPGAARRAAERACRYDLDLVSLVADAERLPFQDQCTMGSIIFENPLEAISEMVQVAAGGISVIEPADAALTALAGSGLRSTRRRRPGT